MTSLCVYINMTQYPCEWDGSLQSICPLNNHCREESASSTMQNANEFARDAPKLLKLRSAVPNPSLKPFLATHFWLLLVNKVAKNGNFARELCQFWQSINFAKICKTCLPKVAKNGNFGYYYRFAIIGNMCNSFKSSQMTTAVPYILPGSIGKDSHTYVYRILTKFFQGVYKEVQLSFESF